jgi:hypothetical protein
MRALLVAGAAFGQTLPFAFTSAYTEYGGVPVYETRPSQSCLGYNIPIPSHPQDEVKEAQCYAKCSSGSSDPTCAGFDAATDLADSDALCLDVDTCKAMCWNLDECVGIEMAKDGVPRCFLNLWECAGNIAMGTLLPDSGFDFLVKQVPWQSSCPLGLSVEVNGGAFGVDGTYLEEEDGIYSQQLGNARIFWQDCQWVIEKPFKPDPTVAPETCSDDVPAANFLFGLVDATYNAHICEIAFTAGYCSSIIFKGVCAATCSLDVPTCTGDNHAAAQALADIWGVTSTGCGVCSVPTQSQAFGFEDPVVGSLCKATCPRTRRLLEEEPSYGVAAHPVDEHSSFGALKLPSHIDVEWEAENVRGLQAMSDWKTYFLTTYPDVGEPEACTPKSRNVELLNDMSLCDYYRFGQKQPGLTVEAVCPLQMSYITIPDKLCPLDHVVNPLVNPHKCMVKCTDGADTANEICDGFSSLLSADALCLPRAECEQLCSSIADCQSIDMHPSLNRCYLNKGAPAGYPLPSSPDCPGYKDGGPEKYAVLVPKMQSTAWTTTADTYCSLTNVPLAELPKDVKADLCIGPGTTGKCNFFGPACTGASCFCEGVVGLDRDDEEDYFALCLDRPSCEAACLATPGCLSFDMHQTMPRCYLNMVSSETCDKDLVSDPIYEIVDKVAPKPCYPKVVRTPTPAEEGLLTGMYMENLAGDFVVPGMLGDSGKPSVYTRSETDPVTVSWSGCSWDIHVDGAFKFSTKAGGTTVCADSAPSDIKTLVASGVEMMYFAFCPYRPGMTMQRVCADMSLCPVLTRCVVTTPRMGLELPAMKVGVGQPTMTNGVVSKLLSTQKPLCKTTIADRTKFVAKQIASPVRAEYNIDLATYGPHFLNHAVYRDEPDAPVVYFTSFGTALAATVTLASNNPIYPDNAETQLGRLYVTSFPGVSMYVSDVIRVEIFGNSNCGTAGTVTFLVMVPMGVPTGAGLYVMGMKASTGEMVIPMLPGTMVSAGTFSVTASITEATDFVAYADIDECAAGTSTCSPFATCTNTIGSFTCTCMPGYVDVSGDGSVCEEKHYECPAISVKVSNGEALDFGWRIREMRLYSSEDCSAASEVAPGTASIYPVSEPGLVPSAGAIAPFNHPREIVRALQCYTKCGSGTYAGARKLSRARRMSILGADWSECGGYDKNTDNDESSTALCATEPTCIEVCNQLPECAGFYMRDGKGSGGAKSCVLYTSTDDKVTTEIAGSFYTKAYRVVIDSSAYEPSHPPFLVYDDNGRSHSMTEAPPYNNTEWWSACYDCLEDAAFVQVTVTLPPGMDCQVHGIKLWQDPEYKSGEINVYAGTPTGFITAGARGASPVEQSILPDMFYQAYRYEGEETEKCMPLTCGQSEVLYTGDVIEAIDGVDSPCLCKQLCFEAVGKGCEIWGLYKEQDARFTPDDDVFHDEMHKVCYLMGGNWGVAAAQVSTWVSDTLGPVLTMSTATAGLSTGSTFSLTVHGIHLPTGTSSRAKIVKKTKDPDMGCLAPPAETVSGIGCSDAAICSPAPSTTSPDSATWTGLKIMTTQEKEEYTVCYCPGPCYAAYQYTPVPGSIEVEGSGFMWELLNDVTSLDRSDGTFSLKVSRPPFHYSMSNNTAWDIKVVPASLTCAAAESHITASAGVIPAGSFPDNFNEATFAVTINDTFEAAGKYIVCFAEAADYVPISSATSFYLDIGLADADLLPPEGLYMNQHFTAMAGVATTLTLKGNTLSTVGFAGFTMNVVPAGSSCSATATASAASSAIDDDGVTIAPVTIATAGYYSVCATATTPTGYSALVGDITVTQRATIGWTYVLDPEEPGSVEIISQAQDCTTNTCKNAKKLNWKKDRIMILDCKATCGISSPAKGVSFEEEPAALKEANEFVAQNDMFDAAATARTMVDLPSELRTYTTVKSHFCKGGNIPGSELPEAAADLCVTKCAIDPTLPGCSDMDSADSGAICLPESSCRELCSLRNDCFGIDVFLGGNRCFLNMEGSAPDGCKSQYETANLGPSTSYKFLAKAGTTVERMLQDGTGLSSDNILRFMPVSFLSGGSYKVCFCDSALLPTGQQYCHAESDYSVEIGELIVSGVSCLLKESDFRRRTCYNMFHGGLICSDTISYPMEAPAASGVLPSAFAFP